MAIHFSLVEREFNESLLSKKKIIIALRAFGGRLNKFFFHEFTKYKENQVHIKRKNLIKILTKYNISEAEARAQYTLKHPLINCCVMSASTIEKLEQLLYFQKKKINKKIWIELDRYSKDKTGLLKPIKYFNINTQKNFIVQNNYRNLNKSLNMLKNVVSVDKNYYYNFYFHFFLNFKNKFQNVAILFAIKIKNVIKNLIL